MDWNECIIKKIVKDVSEDKNKIKSIRNIAKLKMDSTSFLPKEHYISKISFYMTL